MNNASKQEYRITSVSMGIVCEVTRTTGVNATLDLVENTVKVGLDYYIKITKSGNGITEVYLSLQKFRSVFYNNEMLVF